MKGLKVILVVAAVATAAASAFAQANPAFDTASNYGGSWNSTPANLGSGFGPWNIIVQNNLGPPYAGTYPDTSSAVASNGYSWGSYANNPQGSTLPSIDFVRPFTGGALSSGQTFSINLSADGVGNGTGAAQGFSLETAPGGGGIGAAELTLQYAGSYMTDNMEIEDNNGTTNSSVSVNFSQLHAGINVTVTEGAAGAYTVVITPVAGGAPLATLTGTTSGLMNQVDVFNDNTSGNGYFNNISIVPEPSTIGLVVIGLLGALTIRRRKV